MQRLSSPLESMRGRYDVVVVGSGYGGGVAASRLARAGRSVCLLERGLERHPGEYPETLVDAQRDIQLDGPDGHVGSATAMFDMRVNRDVNVVVGCGLGGTSLINANVSLPPDPRVFDDPCWPAPLRADCDTLLADGFAHAREMLHPTAYPDDWPALNKLKAHETSAASMGQPFARVPINVTFEDGVNRVGLEQRRCTLCGNCVTGCNQWSKNTTLMNYLPDAWNHGAHVFTQTLVRYVMREDHAWIVSFSTMGTGGERFTKALLTVAADVVVLAAGTLGSTEILLRSRQRGLAMSPRVGTRFSGNGDVIGFAYQTHERIDGIGTGPRSSGHEAPIGPCITSVIDMRDAAEVDQGFVIEDGSLPGTLAPYLAAPFAVASDVTLAAEKAPVGEFARRKAAEVAGAVGVGSTPLAHVQTFLAMSHDGSDGRLDLESDRLRVRWPGIGQAPIFDRIDAELRAASRAIGGLFIKNPLWSRLLQHGLVTVHPLGGCPIGDDADTGVVNHKGEVFAATSGDAVHDGLYVMDGAVIPRSLGVNPLLTITALAERNCALLARERGWTIDYGLPSSPAGRQAASPGLGLEFTERMAGFCSTAVTDDYEHAARQGHRDGSLFDLVVTVATDDLERMLADPEHPAALYGTVRASALSPAPLMAHGRFNLFVEDEETIHTHRMRYRLQLSATDGRMFYVDGFKLLRDASLLQVWPSTTTLFITIYEGADATGPLRGRGILRITPADFARQMSTLQVRHATDTVQRAQALGRFGQLFAGRLWEHFGGILATGPTAGDRARMREKRRLRAPTPEVFFFTTSDGVELRLVRYAGGIKGPFICAPGFSNTSQVFAWDGTETSWVEFFAGSGYDVWLFDYRASPDLPASRTQFTLDDVARHDWPAAVAYVRRVTGAESVQALGHCLGSATGFMGLLGGSVTGVRQFIGSQVMPFIEVSALSKLKAAAQTDHLLAAAGVTQVTTHAGSTLGGKLVDELLRLYPMPLEWQALGPVCRRIYAIYGPVMKPDQLNRETRDALDWIFGYGNVTSFGQIRRFIQHGRLVDATGGDVYLPQVDRLKQLSVVLMQGADNALFLSRGSEKTRDWISTHHGASSCSRLVFPGYAHLDCFIGRDAARDVFPGVLQELDRLN